MAVELELCEFRHRELLKGADTRMKSLTLVVVATLILSYQSSLVALHFVCPAFLIEFISHYQLK